MPSEPRPRSAVRRAGSVVLALVALLPTGVLHRRETARGSAARRKAPRARTWNSRPRQGRPGETVTYRLHLDDGEYLEVYLDQPTDRARLYLLAPGQPESTGYSGAYGGGEFSAHPPSQVLWEVAEKGGPYRLRVEHRGGEAAVRYRLTVGAARHATERDWDRHRGLQVYLKAHEAWQDGRLEEALSRYDEALDLCGRGGYVRGTASTYYEEGADPRWISVPKEEAKRPSNRLPTTWDGVGEVPPRANALAWLARAETGLGEMDPALPHVQQALEPACGDPATRGPGSQQPQPALPTRPRTG